MSRAAALTRQAELAVRILHSESQTWEGLRVVVLMQEGAEVGVGGDVALLKERERTIALNVLAELAAIVKKNDYGGEHTWVSALGYLNREWERHR